MRDTQYYETVTMEMEIYDDDEEEDGNFLLLFEIFLWESLCDVTSSN